METPNAALVTGVEIKGGETAEAWMVPRHWDRHGSGVWDLVNLRLVCAGHP